MLILVSKLVYNVFLSKATNQIGILSCIVRRGYGRCGKKKYFHHELRARKNIAVDTAALWVFRDRRGFVYEARTYRVNNTRIQPPPSQL